jgi:WD40 repeat protein
MTGAERGRLAPEALPLSLAFHPDGTILAAGLSNSDIQIWDLLSDEVINMLSGSPQFVGVNRLAFTPDGNSLISGTRGKNPISINGVPFQVLIWDWLSLALQTTFDPAGRFGISPDGKSLVITYFAPQATEWVIRIYDLAQLDQFLEIPLEGQVTPADFSFNPTNGWISGSEAVFPVVTNFWNPSTLGLVANLDWDQEYDETGMLYDLNSGGFTSDGYFVLNRSGELLAPEAQPEATGLDEILWECGFALADVQANQIFYNAHPMLYDDCVGPENMYIIGGSEPLILSPDGRFIAGEDGFGSLRLWGIDASQPAIAPECFGDC